MIHRDGSSTSSVAAMIVLTTAPAVPGMLVARSNVLCTVYVPVASSGLVGGWLLPLPPPPPSSPPMSEGPGPQAAVALSASEATRARRVVVIMVFSRRGLLPSALCSACATAHDDATAVA